MSRIELNRMLRILCLILLALVSASGFARGNPAHERAGPQHERGPGGVFEQRQGPDAIQPLPRVAIDPGQAAAAVKQRFQGTILSIRLIENKGPPMYRVKTLSEGGVVKVVFVDGQSGEVFE